MPDVTWLKVCDVSAVRNQEARCLRVGEEDVAVFNLDGQFYAVADRCPHGNASLSEGWVENGEVECPLHQARFDLASGKVLCAPARDNLKTFKVKLADGVVLVCASAETERV
ncbi:bifunctional 3-phenylpropionate/cinnamic acid dioxygenase ferredoxin subunit [Undibacterium arcticum]|uniref:Bifunctional 3-phenylpropionate/cinnamic acid dioxygenase ferredoxin subunit n=1 Tax=Undibacterium arcticum TaxID=1762892 RepID=A0ABV7EUI8_9BURK